MLDFYRVPPHLEPTLQRIFESVGLTPDQYQWQDATCPGSRRCIIQWTTTAQYAALWQQIGW